MRDDVDDDKAELRRVQNREQVKRTQMIVTKRVSTDGVDGRNCMPGYLGRIIDDHGPDA